MGIPSVKTEQPSLRMARMTRMGREEGANRGWRVFRRNPWSGFRCFYPFAIFVPFVVKAVLPFSRFPCLSVFIRGEKRADFPKIAAR